MVFSIVLLRSMIACSGSCPYGTTFERVAQLNDEQLEAVVDEMGALSFEDCARVCTDIVEASGTPVAWVVFSR